MNDSSQFKASQSGTRKVNVTERVIQYRCNMKGCRSLVPHKLHTVCFTTVENLSTPYSGNEWEAMPELDVCGFSRRVQNKDVCYFHNDKPVYSCFISLIVKRKMYSGRDKTARSTSVRSKRRGNQNRGSS
jgi:hypothetical protein